MSVDIPRVQTLAQYEQKGQANTYPKLEAHPGQESSSLCVPEVIAGLLQWQTPQALFLGF